MAPANILPKSLPRPFLMVCSLFILLFVLGYGLAYQLSSERAHSEAQLSIAHLTYLLQVKDDMGLIDWSKSLEKTDDCLAYDVRAGGKSKLSGGNKAFLPSGTIPGQSFQFPSQWCFGWKSPGTSDEAMLVFEAKPFPLFWGLAFGFCSSLAWGGLMLYFHWLFKKENISSPVSIPEAKVKPSTPFPGHRPSAVATPYSRHPYLLVSQDSEILETSDSLSGIFPFLTPGVTIFFDLEPAQQLLDLIQSGKAGRVENAFKKAPGQGATVKAAKTGMLLVLEPSQEPTPPENH